MASMAVVVNTFSTQTSMAAPINRDRTAVNAGKRDAYTLPSGTTRNGAPLFVRLWHPGRFYRDVPDGLRDRGIVLPACGTHASRPLTPPTARNFLRAARVTRRPHRQRGPRPTPFPSPPPPPPSAG